MADQARLKPASTASAYGFPEANSSLNLSKISTFASTAIPIERIIPATPARLITTLVCRRKVMKKKAIHVRMKERNFSHPESVPLIILCIRNPNIYSAIDIASISGSVDFMRKIKIIA